jgi:hypothetical protein
MTELDFEAQLHTIANTMDYPPTPDVAGSVSARLRISPRLRFTSKAAAWSLTIVLILISSLMLIPPVRAAIVEFFQVGAVRILGSESTPTPTPTLGPQSLAVPVTATPGPTVEPLIAVLERMMGESTLEDAQQMADYPILLPAYPADLGKPNRVFVQNAEGLMTILVWLDPQQPERVRLSLHLIPTGSWAINKMGPKVIRETQVNGQYAIWAEGIYPLRVYGSSEIEFTRLIKGHVLIWEEGDITYRLETDLSMEEAIQIAESLERVH